MTIFRTRPVLNSEKHFLEKMNFCSFKNQKYFSLIQLGAHPSDNFYDSLLQNVLEINEKRNQIMPSLPSSTWKNTLSAYTNLSVMILTLTCIPHLSSFSSLISWIILNILILYLYTVMVLLKKHKSNAINDEERGYGGWAKGSWITENCNLVRTNFSAKGKKKEKIHRKVSWEEGFSSTYYCMKVHANRVTNSKNIVVIYPMSGWSGAKGSKF